MLIAGFLCPKILSVDKVRNPLALPLILQRFGGYLPFPPETRSRSNRFRSSKIGLCICATARYSHPYVFKKIQLRASTLKLQVSTTFFLAVRRLVRCICWRGNPEQRKQPSRCSSSEQEWRGEREGFRSRFRSLAKNLKDPSGRTGGIRRRF